MPIFCVTHPILDAVYWFEFTPPISMIQWKKNPSTRIVTFQITKLTQNHSTGIFHIHYCWWFRNPVPISQFIPLFPIFLHIPGGFFLPDFFHQPLYMISHRGESAIFQRAARLVVRHGRVYLVTSAGQQSPRDRSRSPRRQASPVRGAKVGFPEGGGKLIFQQKRPTLVVQTWKLFLNELN